MTKENVIMVSMFLASILFGVATESIFVALAVLFTFVFLLTLGTYLIK